MDRTYKEPDVKAPRFRQEGYNVIDNNFVKNFKEKHPKYKDLTIAQIKRIIKAFNNAVWENVIETRDGVKLPDGLGQIFIGSCNLLKTKNIDHAKSKKYGVTVHLKNWETDGKLAKIFYTSYSSKYKYEFRECWSFKACRNFKRTVAKTYPENWMMYTNVDSDRKMRKTYTGVVLKDRANRLNKEKLTDYNEFDL